MAMTDEVPDSLFKLRLTGALRKRLEGEAAKRGLTLTAEILRRIDETFSDASDRINNLEKVVFDGDKGNESLYKNIEDLYSEISKAQDAISKLEEYNYKMSR